MRQNELSRTLKRRKKVKTRKGVHVRGYQVTSFFFDCREKSYNSNNKEETVEWTKGRIVHKKRFAAER